MTKNSFFFEQLRNENAVFRGWDFKYLTSTGRMTEAPLKWNYYNKIKEKIAGIKTLLDMGTGGGEFLKSLQPLPPNTFATEFYKPNIPIAKRRLKPLNVKVDAIKDDSHLPYNENYFEVIMNRHESFDPAEVFRILKPGGTFITQQVGGTNDMEFNQLLKAPPEADYSYWNLKYASGKIKKAGFIIEEKTEQVTYARFYDIGAIVYYLKAEPWRVKGFSVEKFYDKLKLLDNTIARKGFIDVTLHRFFISCKKPHKKIS